MLALVAVGIQKMRKASHVVLHTSMEARVAFYPCKCAVSVGHAHEGLKAARRRCEKAVVYLLIFVSGSDGRLLTRISNMGIIRIRVSFWDFSARRNPRKGKQSKMLN